MSDPAMDALFDVFEALPRCAPGEDESTLRALAACAEAPHPPRIIDLRDALDRARWMHSDPAAQAALDALDREIAAYDTFGVTYGHRMLVARRPNEGS